MESREPRTNPDRHSAKEVGILSYSREKRKAPRAIKIKFTQILDTTPETAPSKNLVQQGTDSGSRRKRKSVYNTVPTKTVVYDTATYTKSGRKKRKAVVRRSIGNKTLTWVRAEEFRQTLGDELPSFTKGLVRSNVTVGFWMHLPLRFSKKYMPKKDTIVHVEDETGTEYVLNYIADRTALSGGWKKFCASHNLAEGDVLVFQLISTLRFKVYIVKENASENDDYTLIGTETNHDDLNDKADEVLRDQNDEQSDVHEKLNAENEENESLCGLMLQADEDETQKPETICESDQAAPIKENNSLDQFSIIVNDLAIDCEISDEHRAKYHELCSSQSSYLHEHLLQSINSKLAAEIIIGIVNISESIKASKLFSFQEEYALWDKTLKGFELLGMNVTFLRARLNRLMMLASDADKAITPESNSIKLEQDDLTEKISSLQSKFDQMKAARVLLDTEISTLKAKTEKAEHEFQTLVDSPW